MVKPARCTAYATYHAIRALIGEVDTSAYELWCECKAFFGSDKVSETKGTQLWRMLFIARSEFPDLSMPSRAEEIQADFTDDDLDDIEEGKATAIIGQSLHAVAVIDARKSWLGYWQILTQDNNGRKPKWAALWRYRMAKMEVAVIRKG